MYKTSRRSVSSSLIVPYTFIETYCFCIPLTINNDTPYFVFVLNTLLSFSVEYFLSQDNKRCILLLLVHSLLFLILNQLILFWQILFIL